MTPNPDDNAIRTLLTDAAVIAVVGASSNPGRPSNGVFSRLKRHGYRVVPVNPNESVVHGEPSFATLIDVKNAGIAVDVVDVFRRSEFVVPFALEAIGIGAKVLWLQEGVINEEAARVARDAGLVVVQDLCTAVMVPLLRVPPKA